ncbi:MAG: tripartite tricarboxylate transporter substrate binding protein [Desulfohalobiaceae bacterium]|nr:tripartite tricarboxylate transporter substrate binding protein [Desulfohalobiaceae bacterium]
MKKSLFILLASVFLACAMGQSSAIADDFPKRSITLYIPYSAGGSTDTSARVLASAAEKILGQPITCVNKTGGGGTVMLGILSNDKPDGYTLGVIPSSAVTRTPHMLDVEYDPFQDFDFIMKYGLYTMFLVVNGDSPYKTFDDFVKAARENPGKISFATPGPMEAGALALQYVGDTENLEWNMIPFQGSGEGMTALFGKHVDAYSGAGGAETHLSEVKAGDLRVLASYNSVRSPALPDVPTLKDLGYDFAINSGIGIGGPAGIPEDRLEILEQAFIKATESPEFKKVTERLMMPTVQFDREKFRKTMEEDSEMLGKLLQKMGLTK